MNKIEFGNLISLAQKGDELAFNSVLRQSMPCINADVDRAYRIYPYVDRDELLSLAMLGFWEAIKKYNSKNPSYLHYLRVIVRRSIFKEIARNQTLKNDRRLDTEYEDCPSGKDLELDVIASEFRGEINDLIQYLTDHEAKAYRLYFSGYYPRQIADILGIKTKSVYNAIYNAEKKLVKCYQEKMSGNLLDNVV